MTTSNTPYAELVKRLDERAGYQRERGWELMREGDPELLEKSARAIEALEAECDELAQSNDEESALRVGAIERMIAAEADADRRVRLLERCVGFLADLNGSEWIVGDGVGERDMRQRALILQGQVYAAIRSRSNATGEDKFLSTPIKTPSPVGFSEAELARFYASDDWPVDAPRGLTVNEFRAAMRAVLTHLRAQASFDVEKYVAEYVADHGLDTGSDCMLTDFANGMMWAIEQSKASGVTDASVALHLGAARQEPGVVTADQHAAVNTPAPTPPRWKLMPAEPTEEMIDAGVRAGVSASPNPWCPASYRAMYAAAPPCIGEDDLLELAHALDWLNMQAFPGVGTTADYTLSDYMLIPKVEWDSINPAEVLRRYVKRDPELQRERGPVSGQDGRASAAERQKLASVLLALAARRSTEQPLGWAHPDCEALQEAARIVKGEPSRADDGQERIVLSSASTEFQPDWTLTAVEKAIVALSLALPKLVPGWPGCTDEQMENVAVAVVAAVPGLEEANRIATEIGNDERHTAGERAGARMVGAVLRKQLEGVPTPSDDWARLTADALKDPASVHINMVRGAIAIPSLRQYLHARGGGALETFERVVEIAARNESAPEIDKAKIMIEERLYEKEAPNEQK